MSSLKIHPAQLKGTVHAQPSKSIAHRAIICAFLAKGESRINNVVLSDDVNATLRAIHALGADIRVEDSKLYYGRKLLIIKSDGKISIIENVIDCLESGSTARFMMPVSRLVPNKITFTGQGRLLERPFELYENLFREKGIEFSYSNGKMPITLKGKLQPGEYKLSGNVSSQFISGLLFALPLLESDSKIIATGTVESLPYIQMTIQVLEKFGIKIDCSSDYKVFNIKGGQTYKPIDEFIIEGDWSQAAFFAVMGTLSQGITIKGLENNSLQGDKVITSILGDMGANIIYHHQDITFNKSNLNGTTIDVSQCPDLVPALSVAACLSEGTTHILNAERLRLKESDRLQAISNELGKLGANIIEKQDGLIITGVPKLKGGTVNGCGDHRIVMALASASAACHEPVIIKGAEAVNKSYPEFWEDFISIGGRVEAYE